MGIDEKRDLLRQMIEGTIPTKVNKRRDGGVEAVFDILGALVADAKMAGAFDGTAAVKECQRTAGWIFRTVFSCFFCCRAHQKQGFSHHHRGLRGPI